MTESTAPKTHTTVIETTRGARYPHKAVCTCGWASWGYLTEFAAQGLADDHEAKMAASSAA